MLKNMRKLVFLLLCLVFSISSASQAQTKSKDVVAIEKLLFQQQADWNSGNIDAFMTAYWQDEELQFGGASGITKGWQETLDGYKKRYPDKATMGKLTFKIKDVSRHSKKVISLTGSWELERMSDRPHGHFLLIWRKIKGEWKIVADHTSSKV